MSASIVGGDEVAADYSNELADLKKNEKARINFLTMTAHDNGDRHAAVIVKCIERHIYQVLLDR
jgi:hypothetical protein